MAAKLDCRRMSAMLLLAVLALTVVACSSTKASQRSSEATAGLNGAQVSPAVPKPDVVLTDTSGAPYPLRAQTDGSLTLLYLGYTHCPDVCPTVMVDFAATLKSLPPDVAGHIKVVFVTTDPERDTPDVMRTWLDNFNPNFIGLTGTPGQLQALQDELGVPAAAKEDDGHGGYGVSHAAFTFAFTPNDNIAHIVYPVGLSRDELASDFTSLVKNGWTAN